MQYTIEHDEAAGLCIVQVSDSHKRPADSRVLQEVARHVRSERGSTRFLYDMRQVSVTGRTMNIFSVATTALEQGIKRDCRVALVYSECTTDHLFLETVAVNRGYCLRVFDDIAEAFAWLTRDDPLRNRDVGGA